MTTTETIMLVGFHKYDKFEVSHQRLYKSAKIASHTFISICMTFVKRASLFPFIPELKRSQ